ncbi:MAG: SDR family oxidoreductase, partial [Propionibacterium sp.]|nr:SDR family oxidoreductase [Propionibacterium sp.]
MGILEGKSILVTGVTMNTSIAYEVARVAQAEGATVVVSNFGRALSLTRRIVQRLDPVPPVIELDVTDADHLAGITDELSHHVDQL